MDLLDGMPVPLREQLAELKREREQRVRAYPRFIHNGTLKQYQAEQRMRALDAAIATLEALKE